jgi:hypothetical protein
MRKDQLALLVSTLILGVLYCFTWGDPFWGDSVSTISRAAVSIYNSGFSNLYYPQGGDPGHPTLWPTIVAVCWLVTGETLWVVHLLNILAAWVTLIYLYKISKHFIHEENRWLVTAFTICSATFLSQAAVMATHIYLALFLCMAAYALLLNRRLLFVFALIGLALTHLEGAILIASLFIAHLLLDKSTSKIQIVIQYMPAALLFVVWGMMHAQHSGWWFSSPDYAEHRMASGISVWFKNIFIIIWRLADFGYFVLYIPVVIYIWKNGARTLRNLPLTTLALTVLMVSAVGVSITVNNHPAHRYFFPQSLLVILSCGELLVFLKNRKIFVGVALSMLIIGNFIYYPGKQIGDGTLLYRNYFGLLNQVAQEFPEKVIYTTAPTANGKAFTSLASNAPSIEIKEVLDYWHPMDYVMLSSLNPAPNDSLAAYIRGWAGKSYINGGVWISIYANPKTETNTQMWKLREAGAFERWLLKMKN